MGHIVKVLSLSSFSLGSFGLFLSNWSSLLVLRKIKPLAFRFSLAEGLFTELSA